VLPSEGAHPQTQKERRTIPSFTAGRGGRNSSQKDCESYKEQEEGIDTMTLLVGPLGGGKRKKTLPTSIERGEGKHLRVRKRRYSQCV